MRAAIYTRTSTGDGRQHLTNQLNPLREFAARMEWTVAGEYSDQQSGASDARAQLEELMRDASRRKFDVVLVYDLSRLTRGGPAKAFELIARLNRSSVEFWSLREEQFRTSGPAGQLLIAIAAYLAKYERDTILDRIHAGMARARREGKQIGRPRVVRNAQKILELRKQGKSIRQIAAAMKAPPATIGRILKRSQLWQKNSTEGDTSK